jgi:hypothetical protein
MFAEAMSRPVTVRDKKGKIRTLSKQELMVEVMVNKALAGDPKAFAMVVQFAEKFEVFKRQTQNHRENMDSALLKLKRGLEAMQRKEEQESMAEKESQNSPAQTNPNMN